MDESSDCTEDIWAVSELILWVRDDVGSGGRGLVSMECDFVAGEGVASGWTAVAADSEGLVGALSGELEVSSERSSDFSFDALCLGLRWGRVEDRELVDEVVDTS